MEYGANKNEWQQYKFKDNKISLKKKEKETKQVNIVLDKKLCAMDSVESRMEKWTVSNDTSMNCLLFFLLFSSSCVVATNSNTQS